MINNAHHTMKYRITNIMYPTDVDLGRNIVVGIATRYGLHCPRSNTGGGEIFRTRSDRSWDPLSLLSKGYRMNHGNKAARTCR
jgi:hypothetical protein